MESVSEMDRPDDDELALWLENAALPEEEFQLRPGIRVLEPQRFQQVLKESLARNPAQGMARQGLLEQVFQLWKLFGHEMPF